MTQQGGSRLQSLGNANMDDLREMPCGDLLRRVRVHLKQSLEDVERNLRIRTPMLDAIERGAIDELPGRVYAIGFVRTYADYLGLDGDKVVELFKLQYGQDRFSADDLPNPVAMREPRILRAALLIGCLSAALALVGVYGVWQGHLLPDIDTLRPSLSPVSEWNDASEDIHHDFDALILPALADDSGAPDLGLAAPISTSPAHTRILALADSWIEIRQASGRVLFSRTLRAGEELTIPPQPDLTLTTGNAGGITIEMQGKAWPPLGKTGEIRRHIRLYADPSPSAEPEIAAP